MYGAVAVPAASSATSATSADTIALYAASQKASYLCTLTLPSESAASKVQTAKPSWTALAAPPSGVTASTVGAAVALGPGHSVLVAAAGDDVLLGGVQSITSAMLPSVAPQTTGAKQSANPWMRVGALAAASTFSDPFTATSLDSRWTRSNGNARARLDGKGLILAPGSDGVAALMQAAAPGDASLSVQVARPKSLAEKARVGLALYQDDGDWLTLMVDRAGAVTLCVMLRQAAQPCITGKAKANPNAAVWLQVQRSGSDFTAQWSGDGMTWQQVGQWTPDMTGVAAPGKAATPTAGATATPTATATATPQAGATAGTDSPTVTDPAAAPLAFTSWGVLSTGNGSAGSWPHMSAFTVMLASGASATPAPTDAPTDAAADAPMRPGVQ